MALSSVKFQRARALKMMEAKILQGKTNEEIAKDFGVAPSTVSKALSLAKKGDIIVSFEDKLMTELLPLAHEAARQLLTDHNAKVTLEVLKGAGVLKTNPVTSPHAQADQHDLAAYIAQKRQQALLEEQTIDADFHTTEPDAPISLPESAPRALPPGAEGGGA